MSISTKIGYPGLISARKARQTGRIIEVCDGELAGLDTTDGKWYTICTEHGTCICHKTRKLAIWHSSDPLGWCKECRK